MQERYLLFLLERNGLDPQTSFTELPKDQFRALSKTANNLRLPLTERFLWTKRLSQAEVFP